MGAREQFIQLLEAGDVEGCRKAWHHAQPRMPQPETAEEAEMVMHLTRSGTSAVSFAARAYSHAWLTERGLPSQLPDDLKPKAEQMHPRVVEMIGVAVMSSSDAMKPVAKEVEKAMVDAVAICQHDGVKDPELVQAVMQDAKDRTLKKLLG